MAHTTKANAEQTKSTNLDRLAQGISASERKVMLSKMKGMEGQEPAVPGLTQKKVRDVPPEEETRMEFSYKLRKEPFYFRFWIWLRSVFQEKSVEEIYNENLVGVLAHDIERHYPDLLVYRRKVLYSSFY